MNGDRPRLETQSAMVLGIPRNAAALPRIEAPSTMMAIIEQVVTEPIATSRSAVMVREPCNAVTMAAPNTPTAAASDGVARPPYIDPSTHAIRNRAGARSFNAAMRADQRRLPR